MQKAEESGGGVCGGWGREMGRWGWETGRVLEEIGGDWKGQGRLERLRRLGEHEGLSSFSRTSCFSHFPHGGYSGQRCPKAVCEHIHFGVQGLSLVSYIYSSASTPGPLVASKSA